MLDLAGVRLGGGGVHAQGHQETGQGVMPVQHTLGDGHAGGGQGDEPILVHGDVAVFPQAFGGVGDAGLRDAQVLRHVDGTDVAVLLLHHQHGL